MDRCFVTSILLIGCLLLPGGLRAQEDEATEDQAASVTSELQKLEERIEELEKEKAAHEDATRAIIRQTIAESESKINKFVVFGGTFEQIAGWTRDFAGVRERVMHLSTAQLDFEVQVNDWTLGSLILEYDDGTDVLFPTTSDSEVGVDRVNVDTAFLILGDTQKIVPLSMFGRMIVPFGISTGDPVADVLTLEDPLTLEVFEMKEDAIFIGFEFPTPAPLPLTLSTVPPPVRPRVLGPLFGKISRGLGYKPPPVPPAATGQTLMVPTPSPPPFSVGLYVYNGITFNGKSANGWRPEEHYGFTAGYRTDGPWSFEFDVDYNSSVFDSRFLESEYGGFLREIGLVPGMAASAKAKLGPVPFLVEWNGAIQDASFSDDLGNPMSIRPQAWQVSFGYQFDWNPRMPTLGNQGTYLAFGYSESQDLAGATQMIGGEASRVGSVPQKRFLVSAGEWVADGMRVAIEYSHVLDYKMAGKRKSAKGVFTMLTYEW